MARVWLLVAAAAAQDVHGRPPLRGGGVWVATDAGVQSAEGTGRRLGTVVVAPTFAPTAPPASAEVNRAMKIFRNFASLMLTLVVLAIAYVYKNLWFDFVWRATFGQVKAVSIRDVPCLGYTLANWLCPFCMSEWHPPVNVRVIVHQATHLRYASGMFGNMVSSNISIYALLTAGNNPTKTTSMQAAVSESPEPCVFNEPMDLRCPPSVTSLNIEFRESDGDVIGDVDVRLFDVLNAALMKYGVDFDSRSFLDGQLLRTDPMEYGLDYNEKYAGTVVLSFEIREGRYPLPPVYEALEAGLE